MPAIVFGALHPFRAFSGAANALRDDLVSGGDESAWLNDTLRQQLRQLGQVWPLAFLALAATAGLAIFTASRLGDVAATHTALLHGASCTLLAAIVLAVTLRQRWREGSPHIQLRIVTLCAAGIAGSLVALLIFATTLRGGSLALANVVVPCGAIVLTAIALHPARAAILGFAAALTATIGVQAGFGIPLALAVPCLLALVIVTYRLAQRDQHEESEVVESERRGDLAERLLKEFEAHSTGWFWQTDAHGRMTYLSAKVAAELDQPDAPAIGESLVKLFRVDSTSPETERTLAFHLSARTGFSNYPVRPAMKGKLERWWSISGRPITDPLGRFQGFIGSGNDLTETRRADAEIAKLALFDSLTGLANRQRMRLSLDQMLGQHSSSTVSLFLLDLDRFKAVNDTLGHQTGDSLLKQVGQRLQRAIGDAGLVGRLGGDEFQVILPGEINRERLADHARGVINALSQPYFIDGSSISIGCSIGISLAPENGADAETLIRNADLALYAAKGDGRGIHRFFREELLAGAQNRKQLEDDLRNALAADQLHVAYQPVVSTKSERIVGYEALVRWNHPTRGAISPAEFVPVAEDCGLIEGIGEWVLRTACMEVAQWPHDVRVAVNVSPIQFANPNLPAVVTSALAKSGLPPERLELEITEGVFLTDGEASERMFKSLKRLGVRLALDDFGTGYSSLGYLKKAPFDKIKIDQSFVRGAAISGNRNAAIIKAIVTLADTLGMETTAEGVEVQDEIVLIRELGCSHIQGYVYGKPARGEEVLDHLVTNEGRAQASGYRVSRAPRTSMLRTARIRSGEGEGEVRIRNMSSTGALIDGVEIDGDVEGIDIMIELLEDEMFPARLRWAADGRAGIEFAETFNMERLNAPPTPLPLRKAG